MSDACVKAVQQRKVPFQQAGPEQLDIHGQKVNLDLHLMLILKANQSVSQASKGDMKELKLFVKWREAELLDLAQKTESTCAG